MTKQQPTVTNCGDGAQIILVPNADGSLAVNVRSPEGDTYRTGYLKVQDKQVFANLPAMLPAQWAAAIDVALRQRL